MMRVFVIASTPMMRVGLRTILTHGEMQVVGEAATLTEPAIELSEIDVMVVAEEKLLDGLQRTVAEGKSPALLVLSSNNTRLLPMLNALSPQGWGVVSQDASTEQLQAAVVAVAQGLRVIPNDDGLHLDNYALRGNNHELQPGNHSLRGNNHGSQPGNHALRPGEREQGGRGPGGREHDTELGGREPGGREGRPYMSGDFGIGDIDAALPDEALTAREREVLELLSRGLPNKLIARRLQISEHTVKFHVSSIYAKLGATSRTDAVSRGVRRGLITI
ncbi:MAG TPA: response regulator transcription factor [Ktedonobacteraceae bacterium]